MKVSVIGAGNGGLALAFHLVQLGHDVLLYELPEFQEALAAVSETGKIIAPAEANGHTAAVSGESKIEKTSTDIKDAVDFADVIMLIVPAFGQTKIFRMMLPYLKEHQIIINLPGNFASIAYVEIVKEEGINSKFVFVDAGSIPYACRKLSGNQVFISGIKLGFNVGVFPSSRTDEIVTKISSLFSLKIVPCENVLGPGFANMNIPLHAPATVFNAGWIEKTGGKFKFYADGFTSSVARMGEGIDKERVLISELLGNKCLNALECLKFWYGQTDDDTLYKFISNAKHYQFFDAPSSLNNRYMTEDIPYSIMSIIVLGKHIGASVPVMEAVVACAEVLMGQKMDCQRNFDFIFQEGSTIDAISAKLANW